VSVEPAEPNEICITGLGIAACLGLDVETIWQHVRRGESGIGPMPALESPLPPGGDGGQAPELPSDFWPELPREARYLRWTIDAALHDADFGLEDTPVTPRGTEGTGPRRQRTAALQVNASRISLLLGTTLHGMRAGGEFLRTGDYSHLNAFLAGDVVRVATRGLAIGGLAATTCSACSSSLGAIAMAVTLLEAGEADLVIAGGYDAVSEYAYAGFAALRLISEGPLRPFARDRAGMKVAEGYGVVVLERRRDAERRGATIRAVVAGWGESADAFHLTRPHPEGVGALAAMRQAVDRAGIAPAELDMIAAHATGTIENDNSEAAAITALLSNAPREVAVVGLKSHLGHTLGGAGAVELALSAMAIRDCMVPPTANYGDVEYSSVHVKSLLVERDVRYTLNTSLGFGGANTCVVLRAPDCASGPSPRTRGEARRGASGDSTSEAPETRATHAPLLTSPLSTEARDQKANGADVVITGIGVIAPGAIGNDAFLSLARSTHSIDRRTIDDAEYEPLVPNARRLRRMSTYVKLSICAATMAAREAKLLDSPSMLKEAGAILGTTHGSAGYCYEYYEQIVREGMLAANPMLFAEGVPNAAAAQMSLTLGLTGACQTIVGTRTAGLDALRLAALRIATGEAERVIVCAAEESHAILDAAYAACGGKPSVSVAVAFVLERRDVAERRGAMISGTIGAGSFTRCAAKSRPANESSVRFGDGDTFSVEPLLKLARALLDSSDDVDSITITTADGESGTSLAVKRANARAVR
jgi:3-oxoacyl-[acyl-carrier-protein] synthase II